MELQVSTLSQKAREVSFSGTDPVVECLTCGRLAKEIHILSEETRASVSVANHAKRLISEELASWYALKESEA